MAPPARTAPPRCPSHPPGCLGGSPRRPKAPPTAVNIGSSKWEHGCISSGSSFSLSVGASRRACTKGEGPRGGFSGGRAQLGVRTTKAVKKIGCSNLKQMVEDNKLIVEDIDVISELSTFIVKGASFEADDGCNDDLVACLFIFAWMTDQQYFKELTDSDIRRTMMREQQDVLEQDMAPFGFIIDGLEDENIGEVVDEYGTRWNPVVRDYGSNW